MVTAMDRNVWRKVTECNSPLSPASSPSPLVSGLYMLQCWGLGNLSLRMLTIIFSLSTELASPVSRELMFSFTI